MDTTLNTSKTVLHKPMKALDNTNTSLNVSAAGTKLNHCLICPYLLLGCFETKYLIQIQILDKSATKG